jgi:amino acid transporter
MDYEKPEALNPQIYHHPGHQSPQPDGEATLHGFDEPAVPEDKREFRGDSLWYASTSLVWDFKHETTCC